MYKVYVVLVGGASIREEPLSEMVLLTRIKLKGSDTISCARSAYHSLMFMSSKVNPYTNRLRGSSDMQRDMLDVTFVMFCSALSTSAPFCELSTYV